MKNKELLLAALLALACVPAHATDVQSVFIRDLRSQGYEIEGMRRTFLGRTVLTVSNGELTREIVISRNTGEILYQRTLPNASERSSNDHVESSVSKSENGNANASERSRPGGNGGNGNSRANGNGKN